VTGYSLHVVPVALYAWLRHNGDFRLAVTAALDCGGDTDTCGAIVGALCGAVKGPKAIPSDWIKHLFEWPRSAAFIREIAQRLAQQQQSNEPVGEAPLFWPGLVIRNLLFLLIVLVHGFRRLFPPY